VLIDPRDRAHMYLGMSSGGVFETTDAGQSWAPLNRGVATDFFPPKEDGSEYEYGHDPHCVALHPSAPDRLWQQNHCGIYRMNRPDGRWLRIGRNMPAEIGDIGFSIVLHPRDVETAWVFPMDGRQDWPRTSPGARPALYVTRDSGASWERQDQGLPPAQAWWTIKRQAMCADALRPVGLYFGNTAGEVWASPNEGKRFRCLFRHLPQVYAITCGDPA
jgi:hypothetical protein